MSYSPSTTTPQANRKIRPSALRILAISDGEVHDQERTMAAALALAPKLQQHFEDGIQACAVRLSTGGGHADTRALASVLPIGSGDLCFAMAVACIAGVASARGELWLGSLSPPVSAVGGNANSAAAARVD